MKHSISPSVVCNSSAMTETIHLPAKRTFLVRLSDEADPENGLYFGRVEHLQSGETTRFQSESSLREFLTTVLQDQLGQEQSELNIKEK